MTPVATNPSDEELRDFFETIYVRHGFDFRQYAISSLRRRLGRALFDMRCADVAELGRRIEADASAFPELLRFLTIQVSDLFRDPPFYAVFRERIVPLLATYPSIRLWLAGCSTGEEFYSFAILMREEGLFDRTTFYCTDINPEALSKADRGVYPIDRVPKFTENHRLSGAKGSLSLHYTAAYGSIMFDRSLRKRAVFSDHSLATDSAFAEVQVVSCRNVFIYFQRDLQERSLSLFEESLCRRGFLGLGSRESLRFLGNASAFADLDRPTNWYQRC